MAGRTEYRSSNVIIQNILERVIREPPGNGGVVKSHLVRDCGLKPTTADKYLVKMIEAGYIAEAEESWGERTLTRYRILPLGAERYGWFVRINSELE
jgi:predicted transcriptional regulator